MFGLLVFAFGLLFFAIFQNAPFVAKMRVWLNFSVKASDSAEPGSVFFYL
jgi:hypothetical protein